MSRQITEVLIDDVDGGAATTTVHFGYEGKTYEIDLNKRNAKKLDEAMAPWVLAGRRLTGRSGAVRKPGADPSVLAKVRAWATENNIPVAARGRVAQSVMDAYKAAGH